MIEPVCIAILMISFWAAEPVAAVPDCDPPVGAEGFALSENGYYRILWPTEEEAKQDYSLQEATTSDFAEPKLIYEGPDRSTAFSGRRDGDYYYRVRANDGPWSKSIHVVVQHHSLGEALVYLAVGAVVFLATATLVIAGHIAHRREGLQD